MSASPRVLMLGLDALEVTCFDDLVEDGRLPNLAAFASRSERLDVHSEGFELHGGIWPTFASGTGPGTHGVYFWTQWMAEEMRHRRNDAPALVFEPFWAGLPAAGQRASVVDVPFVPAVRSPGVRHYVGWGLHDEVRPYAWPDGFGREVVKRFGRHPLSFDTVEPQSAREKLLMARELRRGVHRRSQLLSALLAEGQDNFIATTFAELHKAGHYLAAPQQLSRRYDNREALAAILQALDSAWPGLEAAAGEDTHIFVFALHGMQEQVPFDHFGAQLGALLNGRQPVDPLTRPDLIRRVRDLVPDAVHRAIWRRLPARFRAARQGKAATGLADVGHDSIFPVAHDQHPAFRVNVRGRERDGVVAPENADLVVEKLWQLAGGLRADDGRPAFTAVWRPVREMGGERVHRLPDALLLANPAVRKTASLQAPDGRRLTSVRPEARNGVHTGRGFCLFRPAGGRQPTRATVRTVDFAPTVLNLLGVPVPASLEGDSFV